MKSHAISLIHIIFHERIEYMSQLLFALDIGTRSVVGTILEQKQTDPPSYHVLDLLTVEHQERAMIDGQIHDIQSVAKVIQEIKNTFEEKYGPLSSVQVAAAGRALKTLQGRASIQIQKQTMLSKDVVQHLELAAVQNAQEQLHTTEKQPNYYCVGYSVLHHLLDGERIGSLVHQVGEEAEVEVIATFLPKVVVESLIASLEEAGLTMGGLTLEPIAAINVLIPPSMRRLNVALVDIGAGTSDIAITKNNTIIAYGMVPIAGDEITDVISQHYLLDFPIAEHVKRQLQTEDDIVFDDILGLTHTVSQNDILEVTSTAIDELASNIAKQILLLNHEEAPQAVMLIGGGSMTPTLDLRISKKLDLPIQRVAIRGPDALKMITFEREVLASPDLVTPVGIAVAATQQPIQYVTVTVNEQPVRLFDFTNITVGDALIAANISSKELFGSPGLGMSVTVNGQFLSIPGTLGTPSTIMKNGEKVTLDTPLNNGDHLQVIEGTPGIDAEAVVQDIVEATPIPIQLGEQSIVIHPKITVNGQRATPSTPLKDRDVIEIIDTFSLHDIIEQYAEETYNVPTTLIVNVDEKRESVPLAQPEWFINNERVTTDTLVQPYDVISIQYPSSLTCQQIFNELSLNDEQTITVTFRNEPITLKKPRYLCYVNDQVISDLSTVIHTSDRITIKTIDHQPFIFSDVFAYVDFQLPIGKKISYELMRNENIVQFTDPIAHGDVLDIHITPLEADARDE